MATLSRRFMLKLLAGTGLAGAVYHPGVLGGLLRIPKAAAQELPPLPGGFGSGLKVAVVGAGVAGLTAAYELSKAGFSVSVLEAGSRYGGRSLTVRPSDPDYKSWYLGTNPFVTEASYDEIIPAEVRGAGNPEQTCEFLPSALPGGGFFEMYLNAGPGRIPTHHTCVLHYCREFGVPMEPYIFVSDANRMQAPGLNNGRYVQIRQFGYDMKSYISEMLYALSDVAEGPEGEKAVEMLREFLVQYGNLSDDGKFNLKEMQEDFYRGGYKVEPGAGTNGGVPREPLAMEEILEARTMWGGLIGAPNYEWQASLLQPSGGMDMIWQAFLAQTINGAPLRDLVRLNTKVTGMRYGGDAPLTVTFEGPDGIAGQESFDFAIVTSLPHYTAQMNMNGILAATVEDHLNSVLYINGGKYGWQGKTRFWEEPDTQIFGGISWTAHQTEQIWYPSDGYNGPTGVLTGGYIHDANPIGEDGLYYTRDTDFKVGVPRHEIPASQLNATRWAEMTHDQRTQQALIGGNALHDDFTDNVHVDRGLSVSWENQAFQFGIGAFPMPESRPDAYQRLIYPIDHQDRVFLAGDYLSFWTGWQEGSVRSVWWALAQMKQRIESDAG